MHLRAIKTEDWQAILEIQAECYQALEPEPLHVLQSKWQVSPDSCFVMEKDGAVLGYCLAHPWVEATPPPLYQPLTELPDANTLYLHDMAISARAQGLGAGTKAMSKLKQLASHWSLPSLSLVAVQGADSFWRRQGFEESKSLKCLGSYTDDASYMICSL
ncbi:GNAT family N-acetyltransferase [Shewanella sp. JM162201]|uniref:GNAT family N-acetyltransferase n=1 Tax=Shewanella jiangmenensis TaxID=2837387 RepID=A0ABS5V1T5_9GAMM|nr:GNAT family N-acetyltransferase [Shewanella jiangmenensis]MBT1444423.1 GNAT family N-acetyltransferase [Shewanella jiangmenensis]